jgi:uncharacterized small protein (DUF1192 family)
MYDEEDRPRPQGATLPRPLATLSVKDLEEYIEMLRDEITRVEEELHRRRDVRGAAEALFKRSSASD